MSSRLIIFIFFVVLPFYAVSSGHAEDAVQLGQSQEPLAIMGDIVLTQAEVDAALSKIPGEHRLPFIRDGAKVEQLVRNLLRNKTLAAEAEKAGFDQQNMVKMRLAQARDAELAKEWIQQVVDDAPQADLRAIAEEKYIVEPGAWKTPDLLDISHILISSENRSAGSAGKIAEELWQELEADPSKFDAMVDEHSEDPSKKVNNGRFPGVKRGDMVESFEVAAFALAEPGQISLPVETPFGFHIIRLNKKIPGVVPPFKEIEAQAIEQAQEEYETQYRTNYLKKLLSKDIVLQDGAAEALAKRYFGENLELAPDFND